MELREWVRSRSPKFTHASGQGSSKLISSLIAPSLEVVVDAYLPAQFAVQTHEEGRACESTMYVKSDIKIKKGDAGLAEAMVENEKQEKGGGASAAFMEDNKESAKPPVMTWKKDSEDYQEFHQLRTAENLENRKNTENKKRKP